MSDPQIDCARWLWVIGLVLAIVGLLLYIVTL
jgi:hypothetical protein